MIRAYTAEDVPLIELARERSPVPRATRPAGFAVSECWGGFLSQNVDNADHMFGLINGVRLMIKFAEWMNDPIQVALIINRAAKAAQMGKKIHLVIDCFNSANGPNDYHAGVVLPQPHKIAPMIKDIIEAFPPLWKVEVFNEPYYCKNHSQRITILKYVDYVKYFVEGCGYTNFNGKLVASQTSKEFWKWNHPDNTIANGWEWVPETVWSGGNLEGRHSAVLHDETTVNGVVDLIGGTWHQGRAIGWRHPIDETECSPVGKDISTNSPGGYTMTDGVLRFMRNAKCPLTILTWGAKFDGFGHPRWPGEMHYVNKHGNLAKGAEAIYNFYGATLPDENGEPPPPSQDWDTHLALAQFDLDKAKRRGQTPRGIRSANRVIEHMKDAIRS